jgi:hypothetical protein
MFKTALTYSLTVVGVTHAYQSFFYGTRDSISLTHLILQFFIGFFLSSTGWSNREDKYRDALIKTRPHNNPGA